MKFSVITACRNAASLLPQTINSVLGQSALKQGMAELEYLIIDGASTDATAEVVSPYLQEQVTFISEPDSGLHDALVKGFKRVTGEVVSST